jgi:hypothetical protein
MSATTWRLSRTTADWRQARGFHAGWPCASTSRRAIRWRSSIFLPVPPCCATTPSSGMPSGTFPPGLGSTNSTCRCRRRPDSTSCRWRRGRTSGKLARRLHVRRLPQCRRICRHPQYPRDHHDRAVRLRRRRIRGPPHQGGAAPAISERRRRDRARTYLWLRRRDRRAGGRHSDPHPAQHQPQPEFRRDHDGGKPRLREAAARAAAAAGHVYAQGGAGNGFDLVTLQDEAHVGFES